MSELEVRATFKPRNAGPMQVHVAHANIATLPVDAIVNPANSRGIMGGGVAGLIRHAGGDTIQAEAMKRAPIAIGAALVTDGGRLPAKFVIHAPIMAEPGMKAGVENLRRATRAALIACVANKYAVLAIPGMGTDVGDVPAEECARAIVEEIRAHRRDFPETIYLVDQQATMIEAFEDALVNAQMGL